MAPINSSPVDATRPHPISEWTGFMVTLFAIPCILMTIAAVWAVWRQKQIRTISLVVSMDYEVTEVANVRTPLLALPSTPQLKAKNTLEIPGMYTPSISPALSGRTEIASPVEEEQRHKFKDIPEFSISRAT
ncbi:hypothetical protein QC764_206276 [Podospora pseudoanserina]|uniref:Uncharacterized protein n=1 Tax=Podospora pseudoanserina TaxID=2609844 RepID=A0ABR0IH07_9PEZI|nr:hypothetical protein QC764_206276 [Podospora pseudoanserina]